MVRVKSAIAGEIGLAAPIHFGNTGMLAEPLRLAHARAEVYRKGPLQPGYVLTVEPGLYFQPDDLTVPEDLRGIGVRIEDDVLVTADGMVNLSAALPRSPDEVEAWVQRLLREGGS